MNFISQEMSKIPLLTKRNYNGATSFARQKIAEILDDKNKGDIFSRRMVNGQVAARKSADGNSLMYYIPLTLSQKDRDFLENSKNSIQAPSFYPTGLAALPFADDVYKQEQFMNVKDYKGKPIALSDMITVKKSNQYAWMQSKVIAKQNASYGARNIEELDAMYSKGPGQHNVSNPNINKTIITTREEDIFIYEQDMEFDEIANKQAGVLGFDYNKESLEAVYKSAAINQRRSWLVGSDTKKGLTRLGIQQTVSADPDDNVLGIVSSKHIKDYKFEDHVELSNRLNELQRGDNTTHVIWQNDVNLLVPPRVYTAWSRPLYANTAGAANVTTRFANAIEIYQEIGVNVIPVPELAAGDNWNIAGNNDCLMIVSKSAVQVDEVMGFGMFGNVVYSNPMLSTASFIAQETQVYPIWNDRIYKIIGV